MRLKGEGRGARRKDRRPLSSLVSGLRGGVQTANKIAHERTEAREDRKHEINFYLFRGSLACVGFVCPTKVTKEDGENPTHERRLRGPHARRCCCGG